MDYETFFPKFDYDYLDKYEQFETEITSVEYIRVGTFSIYVKCKEKSYLLTTDPLKYVLCKFIEIHKDAYDNGLIFPSLPPYGTSEDNFIHLLNLVGWYLKNSLVQLKYCGQLKQFSVYETKHIDMMTNYLSYSNIKKISTRSEKKKIFSNHLYYCYWFLIYLKNYLDHLGIHFLFDHSRENYPLISNKCFILDPICPKFDPHETNYIKAKYSITDGILSLHTEELKNDEVLFIQKYQINN